MRTKTVSSFPSLLVQVSIASICFAFAGCLSTPHYGGVESSTPRDEKVRVVPVGVDTVAINSRSHNFTGDFFMPPGSYTMLLRLSTGFRSRFKQKVSFTVPGGRRVFLCAGKDRAAGKWKPYVKIAPPESRWWFAFPPSGCSWSK